MLVASFRVCKCPHSVGNGNCATCSTFLPAFVGGRLSRLCITKQPTSFVVESLDAKQNGYVLRFGHKYTDLNHTSIVERAHIHPQGLWIARENASGVPDRATNVAAGHTY